MEVDYVFKKYSCPKCNSDKMRIKSGMFTDLYICENCGYESRDINDFIDK